MIDNEIAAREWVLQLCDNEAAARLDRLICELREENARQNLVAKASLEHIWQRHVADSAQLLQHVPRGTCWRWLDLGTGAGFPGVVIAIIRPDINITMIESRSRRVAWLERLCGQLGLANATVAGMRVEAFPVETFDVISARAFAPLSQLLGLAYRFATPSTQWILPKGRSAAHELAELSGWSHMFHVKQSITDGESGIVVGTLSGQKG